MRPLRRSVPIVLAAAALAGAWWAFARARGGEPDAGGGAPASGSAAAPAPGAATLDAPAVATAPPREGAPAGGEPARAPGLFGRVTDAASGAPVVGARVEAFAFDRLAATSTTTDADGRFEVVDARSRSGAFHLTVDKPPYARAVVERATPGKEPILVALEAGGWIEGRVVRGASDPGAPRVEVTAVRRRFEGNAAIDPELRDVLGAVPEAAAREATARASEDGGAFRLGPLRAGTYALVVRASDRPPWFVAASARSYHDEGGYPVVSGATNDVGVLTLPPRGTLSLRVVDAATEKGVENVTFEASVDFERRAFRVPIEPVSRGPRGQYALPVLLEDGRLDATRIDVRAPGFGPAVASLAGQADGSEEVIRLVPAAGLRGDVVGPDGRPMANGLVFVRTAVDQLLAAIAPTDADGRFAVEGLPAGVDLDVQVADPRGRLTVVVRVALKPGEVRSLSLGRTDAASVVGVVRRRGAALARSLVSLDGPQGRTQQWTGADGAFRFDALEPSEYEVFVSAPSDSSLSWTRRVTVAEGRPTRVEIDFAFVLRARVVVRMVPSGQGPTQPDAMGQVAFVARPAGPDGADAGAVEAASSPDGRLAIEVDRAGDFELVPRPGGEHYAPVPLRLRAAPIDAPPGEEPRLEVFLDPKDGNIEVDVLDATTGALVKDAEYRFENGTTSGWGQTTGGEFRYPEAWMGRYHYRFYGDEHVPQTVEVEISPTERSVRRVVRLEASDAVRVTGFADVSRARDAGLRQGDLIVRHHGVRVRHTDALREAIGATTPDDSVSIEVVRDGTPRTLTVPGGRMGIDVENARAGVP